MSRLALALKRDSFAFAGVFLLVASSRIPFVNESFGIDPDAWRIVAAAQNISHFGQYTVSRFPGYPVLEFVYAAFPSHPLWMNGVTVLLSAVAAGALALLARSLGIRHALLVALAFAATPVVYINSTLTLDYVWAIAFALLGLLALVKRRDLLAGLLVGLAGGSRLSSLLFLVPACLFVLSVDRRRGWPHAARRLIPLFAGATLVAGLCYLPAFLRYGPAFLRYYPDATSLPEAIRRATLGVWGSLGVLALALAAGGIASRWIRRSTRPTGAASETSAETRSALVLATSGILVFVLLFFRLPLEEAYLIPCVPFVLIAIAVLAPGRLARLVFALLLLSPFVDVSLQGISEGPLLVDRREKARIPAAVATILERGEQLAAPSVVVSGPWFPAIVVALARRAPQPPIPDAGISQHVVSLGSTRFVFRPDALADLTGLDVYDLRAKPGSATLRGDFVYPERHAFGMSSRSRDGQRSE